MKKFSRFLIYAVIVLIVFVSAQGIYWRSLNKQLSEQVKLVQMVSDSTHIFTLTFRSNEENPSEALAFEIPVDRDIQLHTWAMSMLGNVSVSVIDLNGETVFWTSVEPSNETHSIHLAAGEYHVMMHFSSAFGVGSVVGVSYLSYSAAQASILPDTDFDGLPDDMEETAATNLNLVDTDGDSLSDYLEAVKYKTDPLKIDSDKDGLPDGDWNERREYAYTVRALIRLREPFDLQSMNDLYQDVQIIAGPDEEGYTTIEAVIYPKTHPVLTASAYPLEDLPKELEAYTRPGIATNYDADMQAEVRDIVAGSTTDVQVVEKILAWVRDETSLYLDYSIPEVYFTYLENGKVRVRNYEDSLPVDELLRTHYFAASMFRERTHGTCTSIATLKCAMLKAAGIPCRSIQTLFPIYYHGSQTEPYTNNLHQNWAGCSYEQPPGDDLTYANHAFMEVYLGEQWVRVDENLGIFQQKFHCLGLKIVSVADWSEVDFSETWPRDWIHDRPYYTILVEDQEPQQ